MKHLIWIFLLACLFSNCTPTDPVENTWMTTDPADWPPIAMVNEVWYKNGERYIDPSFEYAGTGFLIDTGTETLAATAKHVLWIAKASAMKKTSVEAHLERWVMHPKGNLKDSVLLDKLINADTSEWLQGRNSSIQERDWIVFSLKSASSAIQALKPAFRQVEIGEKVYYLGCPYNDASCVIQEARVVQAKGNRIIFTRQEAANVGGASGSPIIDSLGYLVGILGGGAINPENGTSALYGISTHYLQKILSGAPELNTPLISIGRVLKKELEEKGIDAAVERYEQLSRDRGSYFSYSFLPEDFNDLGKELLEKGQPAEAIAILELSLDQQYYFSPTFTLLGQAYLETGDIVAARQAFEEALQLWPENERAKQQLEELVN